MVLCRQVDVDVRSAAASLYFFSLVVHFGSVSGSSALFVGRLRTAMELLTPASASEKAEVRERVRADCWALDVEYASAVVPAIASTVMIPIAMTSAIPRSQSTRRRSHRRMPSPSALGRRSSSLERVSATRAVAQHDVVLQLVELDGLRRLDVDREVDAK